MSRFLAVMAAFLFSASYAYAQVIPIIPPLPPPPVVGPSGGAAGGSAGAGGAVVGGIIAYVARGMIGVAVIGQTEKREASACEFLTWPLHGGCAMTPREKYAARVRYAYSHLPAHKERLFFDRVTSYPPLAQMKRELRVAGVVVR